MHVVLLGDSIFDNALYVPGGEPVIEQLRTRLPRGSRATLLAVDGAVTDSVHRQLTRLPDDATHLVVSVGGNDALGASRILDARVSSAAEVFGEVADLQRRFAQEYREMLQAVCLVGKPTLICTIYDSIPEFPPEPIAALSFFNDVIIRSGVRARVPILDLRFVCSESVDYSSLSPIEPSETGGAKIAQAIIRVLAEHDFSRSATVVFR